jgi:hypothetical protein
LLAQTISECKAGSLLFVASFHGAENDQDVEELSPGVLVEKSTVKSLVGCSI